MLNFMYYYRGFFFPTLSPGLSGLHRRGRLRTLGPGDRPCAPLPLGYVPGFIYTILQSSLNNCQLLSTLSLYFNNPSKLVNNSPKRFNKSFFSSTFELLFSTIWRSYSTEAYLFNNCDYFINNAI